MFESIHEECGVFGVFSRERDDVAAYVYQALYALQHRGQESCGIVVNDDGLFTYHKALGLVGQVFDRECLERLGKGRISVGHVRYSTTGGNSAANAQPLVVRHIKGPMSIAHNGNLTNARELREQFEMKGMIFHSTNDTEVISYTITEERLKEPSIEQAVNKAMYRIKGAYSLLVMSPTKLIAARDPNGFRPLCLGRLGGGYVVSSESCAFDSLGAEFIRDIKAGEIVIIDDSGIRSIEDHCGGSESLCVFEYIYFARPDSVIDGAGVHSARINAGRALYKEHPVSADIVIGVPDSVLDAALGFSQESGIPYGIGFIKNRYIGRTFIQPSQAQRTNSVKLKLNAVSETVKGKRVVMIDDSIVRGTTCARIVKLLRDAGAKEVHVRISCPPFVSPCYFGTDIDSKDNLIACRMDNEGIRRFIGADSLGYLSIEGVRNIAGSGRGLCTACFDENYPIDVPKDMPKDKFEYKIQKR